MTLEEVKQLINEATVTDDVARVSEIINTLKKDKSVDPRFIEAIYSGVEEEILKEL